jgi:hypothetical protein
MTDRTRTAEARAEACRRRAIRAAKYAPAGTLPRRLAPIIPGTLPTLTAGTAGRHSGV